MKAERRSEPRMLMAIPRSILFLTALSIAAMGSLWAGINDWTNVGPEGGYFRLLAVDPQNPGIIYAGTGVGVFKSKDGGASWNNAGLNGLIVNALVIDPQKPTTLYAITAGRPDEDLVPLGVYKSTDGGASWNESDSGLPACCVDMLAIDPQNTGTLYAFGTSAPALFKSTDAGANWSRISGLSSGLGFVALAIDPQTTSTLYAAAQGTDVSVLKSMDGGTSWHAVNSGLPRLGTGNYFAPGGLAIDPKNPATIYATRGTGVYRSTDGAASWRAVNSGLPILPGNYTSCCSFGVVLDPHIPTNLYVASMNGVLFKSTNSGESWNAIGSGLVPGLLQFGTSPFAFDPQNSSTVYAATSSGVYKSTDGGIGFAPYSRARALPVFSLALDPQRSGTVLAGIYKSTDAGMSWVEASTDFGNWFSALAIDPQNPTTVYAGTGDVECGVGTSRGIFQSVDEGTSWVDTQAGFGCISAIVIDPQKAGTLYAGSWYNGGVNKSTDGGRSWISVSSGLMSITLFGPSVTALAIDPQSTGTLFAGANGIFKSTDGGAHWLGANAGIPEFLVDGWHNVTALAIDPQTPGTVYAAMAFVYGPTAPLNAAGGLWKSVDGGALWSNVFAANVYAVAIDPQTPATIYAGTDNGLARSLDGGASWSMLPPAPGRVRVLALDPQNPDTVYAGGSGGLFAINLTPVLLSISDDGEAQGAIQHADTYQIVSPANPAVAGEALVIYCTGLINGGGATPQITIGGQMADVLWFGNTPGYASLNQVNVRMPGGVPPGPAISVRMTYAGRDSNAVTIAVR